MRGVIVGAVQLGLFQIYLHCSYDELTEKVIAIHTYIRNIWYIAIVKVC